MGPSRVECCCLPVDRKETTPFCKPVDAHGDMLSSSQTMAGAHGKQPANCTVGGRRMLGDDSQPTGCRNTVNDGTIGRYPSVKWLWTILRELHRVSKTETLVGTRYPEARDMMAEACLELGLDVTLGMARGSGASVNRASKLRSLPEVKKTRPLDAKRKPATGRKGRSTQRQLAYAHWTPRFFILLLTCRTCARHRCWGMPKSRGLRDSPVIWHRVQVV